MGPDPGAVFDHVYAALDLGTNNCRLLVARPTADGFVVIDAFSRISRLGEGVYQSRQLSEAAMARTIEALKVCRHKIRRYHVSRSRFIATEACRIAENCQDFIDRVEKETSLNIDIIDQETEAKLAVSGCASLLDKASRRAFVFDIGGGSSELILLDLARRKKDWKQSVYDRMDAQNCIEAWTSLPVGVVTLAEKFGGQYINESVFKDMVSDVLHRLEDFEAEHLITHHIAQGDIHFLGTSGTVTTVAALHLGLHHYDRERVDGCWLHRDEALRIKDDLMGMTYHQRVAHPCIGKGRADLVLAGCAILEALMRMWPADRLRVADRGLREGILASLMAEDGAYTKGTYC